MMYVFYILDYVFWGRIKGLRAASQIWDAAQTSLDPLEI